ncbi:MAG TPA: hypothetical protein VMY39_05355, partial [Planctomycetota bacterium]|nr:hypothetical protein [Planctomycetota bacterium]
MKRCVMLWTLAAVLASAGSVLAADELSAGEKLAVESLIKQFQQRSFADRQKATERLIELGPKVLPVVQQALAGATDNEVKLRCRMVLDGIAKKYGVRVAEPQATGATGTTTTAAAVPGKLDLEASKVTINAKGALLDDILQQFAEKSGNRVIAMPENWQGGPIDFSVTDMPYWQALDKLCAQIKLACSQDRRAGTTRLVPAEKPSEINVYTGPVVVRVESATKRRTFGSVDAGRQPRDGLFYQLSYAWEDRIRPLATEATVTQATTADGKALKLDETPAFRGMGMGRAGAAGGSLTVDLVDVPAGLERIALLEGTVKMSFGEGRRQVKINDVFGEGEHKVVDGDATLTVARANRGRGGAFVLVTRTVNGEETPMPNYPADSGYGFSLLAPDGKEYRSSGGFGGPGGGFQRGPGGGPGGPPGQPQDNNGGGNN